MNKKHTVSLSFDYMMWNVYVDESQATKSVSKMKKIIANDIRNTLMRGCGRYGENKPELRVDIPFFPILPVNPEMKVKIEFADGCKFNCDEFSELLKTRDDHGEITVEGQILVSVSWNV